MRLFHPRQSVTGHQLPQRDRHPPKHPQARRCSSPQGEPAGKAAGVSSWGTGATGGQERARSSRAGPAASGTDRPLHHPHAFASRVRVILSHHGLSWI